MTEPFDIHWRAVQALPAHVVVLDREGRLLAANRAWNDFAAQNDAGGDPSVSVGANYLDVCRRAVASGDPSALDALQGIDAVMAGRRALFTMEYPCHSPQEQRWFTMTVAPLGPPGEGAVITHTDLTPQKRAEEALRASEGLFRAIFEGAPIAIALLDIQAQLAQFNPACCALLGYTPEELQQIDRRTLVHLDDREENMAEVQRLLTGEKDQCEIENRFVRKDGRPVWVHKVFSVLRDAQGKPAQFISLITDVTARREAEAALRESEERYRSLVEQAVDCIALIDAKGRFLDVNPAGVRMFGYAVDELRKRTVTDVIDPGELPRIPDQLARLDSSDSVLSRWLFRRKDGSTFTGELVGRRLPDGRLFGQLRDISARRRAEAALERLNATLEERVTERTAALRSSEEQQRAILDTVLDAIVTIDKRGTIVDANLATEGMFGFSRAEMIGQNVSSLMPSPYREEHDGYLRRYIETGVARIMGKGRELVAQRKDGTVFPIDLAVTSVDHLGLFTGVIHDLTRRKQVEADVLRISEQERERAAADLHDGVCQELIGISLHTSGMLPELQALSPRLAERLGRIANAMAQAAEHTRQVARGMNPMIAGGEGLMDALRALAETTRRTHQVRCSFQCPAPVSVPEPAVAFQLYRVAQEAIHNAIRHGEATRITVRLTSDEGALRLAVRNNGLELPEDAAQSEGLGLRTMRYRLGLIGGELSIVRSGRGGVEVRCLVPRAASTR